MKYLVKTPFLAVYRAADGKSQFVNMEPGHVFTLRGEEREGMINVLYQGRIVSVFVKDIEERSQKIKAAWE
jgi:hypothetical protein